MRILGFCAKLSKLKSGATEGGTTVGEEEEIGGSAEGEKEER